MAFDPDAYLAEAPVPAAAAKGFDPDEYLAAQPTAPTATPLPRPRPEEAPSTPIEQPPLPRERPAEAPPRPAAGVDSSQPLYDELADVGRSFKRGVHQLRQGGNVLMAGAEARPLNNLTSIEERIAAGEKPESIPDAEDLFGARFMTPEQRAGLRTELQGNVAGSVKGIAEREKDIKALPTPPEVAAVSNAKTFREGWEAFKEHPIKVIAHLGAESAASSAPGIVGSLVTGPVAGLTAAAAVAGAGSYGTDYAGEILDGLRDAKVDLNDEAAIKKAMSDPKLLEKIGQKAHAHAVPVAALDAASMKMAGASPSCRYRLRYRER
jgi:hypothetical protein